MGKRILRVVFYLQPTPEAEAHVGRGVFQRLPGAKDEEGTSMGLTLV
jgi:hypothetical protein